MKLAELSLEKIPGRQKNEGLGKGLGQPWESMELLSLS